MLQRMYGFLYATCRHGYQLFRPAKVTGKENIPAEGGFILCANHQHWLDPIHIAAHLGPRRYRYLAKAETFKGKFAAWFLGEGMGAIPIKRGESDLNAIRMSLKAVADGGALGVFPQGTRSRDNTPTPMQTGVAMIALRSGAPVIPVFIEGPYRLFSRKKLAVGKPVDFSDLGRRCDSATMEEMTRRIEKAIWGLGGIEIPEKDKK